MRRHILAWAITATCAVVLHLVGVSTRVAAQSTAIPDPNAGLDRSVFGEVSPLIPMQSSEAVHMGLLWRKGPTRRRFSIPPGFRSIAASTWPTRRSPISPFQKALTNSTFPTAAQPLGVSRNNFNTALRDVLHGFDPFVGLGLDRNPDDSFQRLTYGGYLLRQASVRACPPASRPIGTWSGSCCSTLSTPLPSGTRVSSTPRSSTRRTSG